MSRLFGTDGVRGLANGPVITAELALSVSRRGGPRARPGRGRPGPPAQGGRRPRPARLGRVPRRAAVVAGLAVGGGRRLRRGRAAHPGGRLPDRRHRRRLRRHALGVAQRDARQRHQVLRRAAATSCPTTSRTGSRPRMGEEWDPPDRRRRRPRRADAPTATPATSRTCCAVLPNRLDGLRVVIDGAHGAASQVSPEVFRLAGADGRRDRHRRPTASTSTTASARPTSTRSRRRWSSQGADLGIAHDGDADRCLAVDATGTEVDGDQIMAILAVAMKERGALANDTLVATVMSNLGLLQAMDREGIQVIADRGRRPVRPRGDARSAASRSAVSSPGTSSSSTTAPPGDGVLTGLMLAARVAATGRPLVRPRRGDDAAPAGAHQRQGCRQVRGWTPTRSCSAAVKRRGGRARRLRPGAAAQVRHRAARPSHGRGRRGGAGQGGRRAARRCRAGAALPLTRGIRTAAYGSPGITRTR